MSTDQTRARQPKGTPVGGQFAAGARDESGISLGADDSGTREVGSFEVTVKGNYIRNEIPPRHRKPRPVRYEAEATATIPSVTDAQAPVAIEYGDSVSHDQVRSFDGHLYAPYLPHSGQTEPTMAGEPRFPATEDLTGGMYPRGLDGAHDQASFETAAQERFDAFLIVDDQVWIRTGEPRYVVQTFGLGLNHGGTDLSIATHDNPNIAADGYFRADDFEGARAHAIEVATDRGDTDSVARIEKMTAPITVHDPSALRLVTAGRDTPEAKAARHDYRDAVREYEAAMHPRHNDDGPTPEEEQAIFDRLVAARTTLGKHSSDIPGYSTRRRPYEAGRDET